MFFNRWTIMFRRGGCTLLLLAVFLFPLRGSRALTALFTYKLVPVRASVSVCVWVCECEVCMSCVKCIYITCTVSILQYSQYTTVQSVHYSTVNILQYSQYTTVQSVYYSTVSILQCSQQTTAQSVYYSRVSMLQHSQYTTVQSVHYSTVSMLQYSQYATVQSVYYSILAMTPTANQSPTWPVSPPPGWRWRAGMCGCQSGSLALDSLQGRSQQPQQRSLVRGMERDWQDWPFPQTLIENTSPLTISVNLSHTW